MAGTTDSASEASTTPYLHVVQPDATPEEVAAIVAVVSAMGTAEEPRPRRRSEWGTPRRRLRTTYAHGPGAWRASGLPR